MPAPSDESTTAAQSATSAAMSQRAPGRSARKHSAQSPLSSWLSASRTREGGRCAGGLRQRGSSVGDAAAEGAAGPKRLPPSRHHRAARRAEGREGDFKIYNADVQFVLGHSLASVTTSSHHALVRKKGAHTEARRTVTLARSSNRCTVFTKCKTTIEHRMPTIKLEPK